MMDPRETFFATFEGLENALAADEILLCNFLGEQSDFIRLNNNAVVQAGHVRQLELEFRLIRDHRSANAIATVSGMTDQDIQQCQTILASLRRQTKTIPEDPYLSFNRNVENTDTTDDNRLLPPAQVIEGIVSESQGLDLVGLYAAGRVYRGFANSLGQRNWYARSSFNFDWSCYREANKAVKNRYAGFCWEQDDFSSRTRTARQTLQLLAKPQKTIPPGQYRVFLAAEAVQEILGTVSWQGFGAKNLHTRQSPLLRLIEKTESLSPSISICQNNRDGMAPDFTSSGFLKPPLVGLIKNGQHAGSLINARSAMEFGLQVNAESEFPDSLELGSGSLATADVLETLDTGLYISNLWYTNYSDPNDCRITGMTRFACFMVENGKIVFPISPMRFDESLYRMFGENLVAITGEQQWILSNDTYYRRSVSSARMPGLLIDRFSLTL